MRRRGTARPCVDRSAFAGFRFPPEVITVAVRWYLRYGLSYRDVEELLGERGIAVDHVTVYRWVQRFTPLFADAALKGASSAMSDWSGSPARAAVGRTHSAGRGRARAAPARSSRLAVFADGVPGGLPLRGSVEPPADRMS